MVEKLALLPICLRLIIEIDEDFEDPILLSQSLLTFYLKLEALTFGLELLELELELADLNH